MWRLIADAFVADSAADNRLLVSFKSIRGDYLAIYCSTQFPVEKGRWDSQPLTQDFLQPLCCLI